MAFCLLIQYGFAQTAQPPITSGRTRTSPSNNATGGGGENVFPNAGFAGIGTQTPGAPL